MGVAKNFTLTDFHPEFLDNSQGLALELMMKGSSLNGGSLQQSGTTLNFGNLEGFSTSTAIWYFQTNMQGKFSDYEGRFTRIDSLGQTSYVVKSSDTDVSLIESVNTHMLTRSMNADGDGKVDFLVNDDAASDMADGMYFGDGSYAAVNGVTGIHNVTGSLGMGNATITLSMYAAKGWNYFRINDPGKGNWRIESISVGGVELDSSMFWQTDRIFAADGTATYVDRLHWVAEFEASGYVDFTVTYSSVDEKAPGVASITGVEDKSAVREAVDSLTITFDEAVNVSTFKAENITLKCQNEYIDLTGLTWEWAADGLSLTLTNLAQFTQQDGLYVLKVLNTGVEDIYGNAGDGSGRQLMWTHAIRKVGVELVDGHINRKQNTRVNELAISFTEPVATFTMDALTIEYISADGSVTTISDLSGLTLERLSTTNFRISGLAGLQGCGDGSYRVSIDAEKVYDANGNAGIGVTPVIWGLYETPPTVLRSTFEKAEQIVQEIDTITLHFSHAVSSFDISKLTLTCNGEVYTSSELRYTIDANDPTKVVVKGISKAVPAGKAAAMPDGAWQLTMDMSGVEDIYGNLGEGAYATDWTVDTIAPAELGGITLNGKESLIVAASSVTIGATLPESGLTVSIYDKSVTTGGMGTLLWSGVVSGTELSQKVTLLNGGSRVLTVVTTDAAGNATTNSYNVLVDMVVLTAETDLAEKYKEVPDSVTITFSAAIAELPLEALSLSVNGVSLPLAGCTLTKVSDTQWNLSGLRGLGDTVGSYALSIDLSQLNKAASGLAGQGSYTQSFTYDPVTEVRITNCEITAGTEKLTGLSLSFSAGINYEALQASGLLQDAVRLVNQADGSVVELPSGGFAWADKTLTWSGELSLAGGSYAVVVDPALLTAANGSPLVGNGSTAETSIVSYKGDALLLGAAGAAYSAPYAVDWNGDGYVDLLVGEKLGSEGKVRLYLNNGSGGFSNYSYLQSNGSDLSVSASGCQGIVVALQDITGDGVADLVAGLSNGMVQYYAGQSDGRFGEASVLFDSSVAGSRAYPAFHDWNGDGVTDIIIGTGNGSLMVGLGSQDAATGALSFATPEVVAGIEVPGRAAPVFADVNGDSVADLILGAGDGSLTLFYGTEQGYQKVSSWSLPGINWERSRVTVADMNADGTTDIIVGGSTGEVYVVYGSAATGTWGSLFEVTADAAISTTSTSVQGKTATLAWVVEHASGELCYVVEVADNAGFAGAVVHEVTATSLTLADLAEGSFFWRVSIKDSSKPVVSGGSFTVDTVAPGAPAELTATVRNGAVVLAWGAQEDASGVRYEVRYSNSGDFSASTIITSAEATLNLSGLAVGAWYWQVRAVDGAGNASEWSSAAEAFEIEEIVLPEDTAGRYWAAGLVTSGEQLLGGFSDADKTGSGDSQLCWAASVANMLAWWQEQYGVSDFSSSAVPGTADAIYGSFVDNWANVSGREEYGLTWWISGKSENASYNSYYSSHYEGSGADGAYYAPHYDAAATSALVREVSLTGVNATQLAQDWAGVFADGGILSLGLYSSLSGTTLVGGHALTLWGFATDASGRLTSITVTDSDDGVDCAVTLALVYNVTKGYYQIAQSGSRLNGHLLGDYTSLSAFTKPEDANDSTAEADIITMAPPAEGSDETKSSITGWVGTGDKQDYYTVTAESAGTYKFSVATGDLDSALWLSVGTLDADGEFVVVQEKLVSPGDLMNAINGVRLEAAETCYIRISTEEGGYGSSYELTVKGTMDKDILITDNNTKAKASQLVSAVSGDACISSWVGSGDARDVYYFDLDEACNFTLRLSGLEKIVTVKLYYDLGDGRYSNIKTTTVRPNRGLNLTAELEQGRYYFEIASYDEGAGNHNTAYTVQMEKEINGEITRLELASDSPLTDNNTKETATELELVVSQDAVINSWVGSGDALDYYKFNFSQEGTLSLCLSELENHAKVKLFSVLEDGSYSQLMSTTVRANRGLDQELSLLAGDYYLEISSYDNGAGRYNTTYALELETEEDGEVK
ncbi:MAG: VCBS repeat-containing protein, partial [Akkermansia sp.]|nr:VCBS repeat-containing protein [Akkermansia sp.]